MSDTRPAETVDVLVAEDRFALAISDLDRTFRLKLRSMVTVTTPLLYHHFSAGLDVAAFRAAGYASVLTFVEHERVGGPLAVAGPVDVRLETRHSELSGAGLGTPASRLGFESRYSLASPPGYGDPLRYRELRSPEPQCCGRGRMILTLLRPFERPSRRLVRETPDEIRHLAVRPLDPRHPTVESLSEVGKGCREITPAELDRSGIFGLQHTDTNRYVYSGEYLTLVEDHATLLAARAGLPVTEHGFDRVAAAFKRPCEAGDRYLLLGRLWRNDDRILATIGIHGLTPTGPTETPSVFARLEGRV